MNKNISILFIIISIFILKIKCNLQDKEDFVLNDKEVYSREESHVLCPEKPNCPCICSECGPTEGKKNSKNIFAYITNGQGNNLTYFTDDPSFKWDAVDIIAIYGKSLDPQLTCLAHRNKVKIVFMMEESNIISGWGRHYWDGNVNLTRLLDYVESRNGDGLSLDFESRHSDGKETQYSDLLKLLKDTFKSVDINYHISTAMSCYYSPVLGKQLKQIAENVDHIIIMGYDFIQSKYGTNQTSTANSPNYIRGIVNKWWVKKLRQKELIDKLILAIPFYGYISKCDIETGEKKHTEGEIFANNCIMMKPTVSRQIAINSIIEKLNGKDRYINVNDQLINLSSGFLWNSHTLTVYTNIIGDEGSVYQINYDSPQSIFKKVHNIGIGGIGIWTLDKIRRLPEPIIESWYYSISRDNIGDTYID